MVDEADQGIDHVVFAATLIVLRVTVDDVGDRFSPLLDDAVEVPIDQVGGLGANLDALGRAAPNCLAPQARERLFNFSELMPYRLQLFGSSFDRAVGCFTVSLGL